MQRRDFFQKAVAAAGVAVEVYPHDTTAGVPSETASSNQSSVGNTRAATTVFVRVVYVA